jgi:hypothetical protein
MIVLMYKWRKKWSTGFRTDRWRIIAQLVDEGATEFDAGGAHAVCKTPLLVSFPNICPEPVLVNDRVS